jgi:hypothetical protein
MQCVELHDDSENPIHCPFCGIKIAAGASEENVDAWLVGRCEHLLFAAIDEVGFEYRSERFDGAVKAAMSKKTDEEREYLEDDAYQLAELVEINNGVHVSPDHGISSAGERVNWVRPCAISQTEELRRAMSSPKCP